MKWKALLKTNSYVSPEGCRVLDDRDAEKVGAIANAEGFLSGISVAVMLSEGSEREYLVKKSERLKIKLDKLLADEPEANADVNISSEGR